MKKNIIEYYFSKSYLILTLFVFLLFILNIDITKLPDYNSYERIYSGSVLESISVGGWEPFFMMINFIANSFDIKYDDYRLIVLFTSILLWFLSFTIIKRKEKKSILVALNKSSLNSFRIRKYSMFINILIIFSIVLFMFEFYIIRIRAGLAISFFIFAFAILWNRTNKASILNSVIAFILLLISSQTHFSTFVILSYLVLFPYLIAKVYFYAKFKYKVNFNFLIYICLYILSILVLKSIIDAVEVSRIGVASQLNPVRFFSVAILPLLIALPIFKKKKLFLNLTTRNVGLNEVTSFRDVYYYFIFLNYIYLLINLVFFYSFGLVDIAGEAVVRVYSLAYIPAFLIIFNTNKKYVYFWLIVILVNALFFMNTIYG